MAIHLQFARQVLGGARSGPSPTISRRAGTRPAHLGQNTYAIEHALDRAEIGEVNQQLLATGRVRRGAALGVVGMVQIAVDEVLDHANLGCATPKTSTVCRAQVVADGK